jgi:hypothetical protein
MLGDDHPACNPSYSHKYAIRSLVPMAQARAALGVFKTSNRVMHCGPGAHALTFPVANNTILNVVAFVTDPEEWVAPDQKFVIPATKAEAARAFSTFSPVVRDLINLLPENLDKWAVFDTDNQYLLTSTVVFASLVMRRMLRHPTTVRVQEVALRTASLLSHFCNRCRSTPRVASLQPSVSHSKSTTMCATIAPSGS